MPNKALRFSSSLNAILSHSAAGLSDEAETIAHRCILDYKFITSKGKISVMFGK